MAAAGGFLGESAERGAAVVSCDGDSRPSVGQRGVSEPERLATGWRRALGSSERGNEVPLETEHERLHDLADDEVELVHDWSQSFADESRPLAGLERLFELLARLPRGVRDGEGEGLQRVERVGRRGRGVQVERSGKACVCDSGEEDRLEAGNVDGERADGCAQDRTDEVRVVWRVGQFPGVSCDDRDGGVSSLDNALAHNPPCILLESFLRLEVDAHARFVHHFVQA